MFVERCVFIPGEVYLFSDRDPHCDPSTSLWGMYDKSIGGAVYLSSSSRNMSHFAGWHKLSSRYVHCRLATRAELYRYAVCVARSDYD